MEDSDWKNHSEYPAHAEKKSYIEAVVIQKAKVSKWLQS